MHRSHSRSTQPFDKMSMTREDVKWYFKNRYSSVAKRVSKKLQQRKQRQWNKKLALDQYSDLD